METFLWILGILAVVGVAGYVAYRFFKKKTEEKLFTQIYAQMQMVPKQKRRGFVLLMFKETLANAKKKKDQSGLGAKFQNPKFLEMQLIQMNMLLNNPEKATDKTTKRALAFLKAYEDWEKKKSA